MFFVIPVHGGYFALWSGGQGRKPAKMFPWQDGSAWCNDKREGN